MSLIHVLVVTAVLQWSVVTGEGRTDQLTLSLCRVWQECVETAINNDLEHAELGTLQAICGDFLQMLEKHGVDCGTSLDPDEETADVGGTLSSLDPHTNDEEQDWVGNVKYARYSTFSVGPMYDYILSVGGYSGTAGDGFLLSSSSFTNNGAKFSTRWYDQGTDSSTSMAEYFGGGWWFNGFGHSNLNGPYFRDPDRYNSNDGLGVFWYPFYSNNNNYSLKKTKMMIRPTNFSTRVGCQT
uniref:Fibrinogen C-terminal domain-containing protein n=1 Tax=Branchiostoma floridae TaxID=7739 RepID=C3YEU9_BRAFL|eukprot:XP_002605183.1 hypothetical protein BRAFLDRAFT_80875 [Branchiostoma floridae]